MRSNFINPRGVNINTPRDAFSRLRVSDPVTIFDSQFQYDLLPLIWDTATIGGGTVTHNANESCCVMTVSALNDEVIRQTHGYFRYQPGKSQLISLTFLFGAVDGVRRRVGYFDADNGIYLEQYMTFPTIHTHISLRSKISGIVVNTNIDKANWNIDKFDGQGPSRKVLDLTKTQILIIDLQWLGVGRVRVGFDIDGEIFYAHEFLNANVIVAPYMTTANLPIRYEITAISNPGGAVTMKQICSTAISEGGFEEERGVSFTASNGITSISVTTRRPVLSIRPKLTFNSITNRGRFHVNQFESVVGGGTGFWEMVYRPESITGASFTSVNANSIMEFDVAASAITGGTVIASGYNVGGASVFSFGASFEEIFSRLALTLNIAGDTADILTIMFTSFTGTITTNSSISWKELR